MNRPKRECGSCEYWIKWKEPCKGGRGLCELLDVAGKAQDGRGCLRWTGRKNRRTRRRIAADVLE